ncbi:hypothetical protein FNV43_RR21539 [Rhamnella rubrinervis]|uniref:Cytochrome P450 71A1 n=1 Tax=Rhamnella rubrinervis TaxID=2594499 RepID=A0A8K0GXR7_9ROSA|nr:hypothetical protein FNV43_RR21539 [Rhamnella rubrinervis]
MGGLLLPQFFNVLWREVFFHPLLVSVSVSVFFVSLLFLFICRIGSSGVKLNLPPSPPRLPLIGNLHQLGSLPHRSLRALAHKYGPDLMLLYLGQVPALVVSSAGMVREMVKNHDIAISNRPRNIAPSAILYDGNDVGFAPYGEHWKQARKISVVELLSVKRVQEFQRMRDEEVTAMVDRIRSSCVNRSTINIGETLIAVANNIVSRCALGKTFMEADGRSRMGELTREMMVLFGAFSFGDFFPGLKWMDVVSGLSGRLKTTSRKMDEFLDQVIEEHKANLVEKKDFVDILLQVQNQKDEKLGSGLTQQDIKGILADMFVAGTDTTSTVMEWLMAELVRNPEVMKKAQEEVRRVVGKKSNIDMEDINQMGYLKCVIKESLRLHPSLPLLVPRQTSESIQLGGFHIPAETTVFVNAWAIQRDPTLWDRPEEFIPERFENSDIDFKGQDFQFSPFGTGRRGCPGMTFGITVNESVIANLLYWFDWKLPGGVLAKDLDMTEAHSLTVFKKLPFHLLPIPYNCSL